MKALLALLAVLGLAATVDGVRLARIRALNDAIANGSIASRGSELPPQAQFARAYYLERRGNYQAALTGYKQLESAPDATLRQAARYNAANIYLRQALRASESDLPQQVLPLAELAKSAYREVLREDSRNWDAKYNFERALRLVPDPEDIAQFEPPLHGERAVTTMRAVSLGLP